MNQVRVRIAPSPTGIPHIGNTRTALFNYLFARHHNGVFILRIEDTDQKRIVQGAKEAISEILHWLGLVPDEEHIQSERLAIYKEQALALLKKRFVYEEDGALWIRMPKGKNFSWTDAIGGKHITFKSDVLEDYVILKSDGFPTYHLASVVDDHLMNISHVIRGEEWISSTPKHLHLYECFSWKPPIFAHLPVILGPDKAKLSKRHGAESVLDYKAKGYLKEALLNFMALLGWSPGGDRELMTIDEMISFFDLKDVNTANPIFDMKKLMWMNGQYIMKKNEQELIDLLDKKKLGDIDEDVLLKVIGLAKSRMRTLEEFYDLSAIFSRAPKIGRSDKEAKIAKNLESKLVRVSNWQSDALFAIMKDVMEEEQIRMPVLYKVFTGKESGLPLPQTLALLGKEKTLELLQ